MNNSNVKVYLAISGAFLVLIILISIVLYIKQPVNNRQQPITNFPTPTSVNLSPSINNQSPNTNSLTPIATVDFTGLLEEEIPKQVIDLDAQKVELSQKTPLDLSSFTIDFNYSDDKFIVILKDPKDQTQKEFENWRTSNYPALGAGQFIIK